MYVKFACSAPNYDQGLLTKYRVKYDWYQLRINNLDRLHIVDVDYVYNEW